MASLFHPELINTIYYECSDESNFLSNFFPSTFSLSGHSWPTVLHYFIARKFGLKEKHLNDILLMTVTLDVHLYSRDPKNQTDVIPSWNLEKKGIMKEALKAKFEQNIILKQKLLDTEGKDIIERAVDDSYWSQLASGTGHNHMGKLLTKVRSQLKTPPRRLITSQLIKPNTVTKPTPRTPTHQPITLNTPQTVIHESKYMPVMQSSQTPIRNLTYKLASQKLTSSPTTNSIIIPCGKYKEFSLLSIQPFALEGHHWWSVQHYYQTQKYPNCPLVVDQILKTASPEAAFKIGTDRKNSHLMVENWDSIREGVMLKALRAKFCDDPLRTLLLSTENKNIINNNGNEFWGTGKDGNGQNKLGNLLMKVRDEMKRTGF
ncbi:hypothetical protein LOD99_57 [Oopsacas minuta]|uniref:NADAR domain-containing protein n=1 Tax=Oopsacas minuta TaxID=111878 RepID=A0AAV7K9J7_9METZ|nr:hypothetical protein LOD99_57 [Oopsacas minuta]